MVAATSRGPLVRQGSQSSHYTPHIPGLADQQVDPDLEDHMRDLHVEDTLLAPPTDEPMEWGNGNDMLLQHTGNKEGKEGAHPCDKILPLRAEGSTGDQPKKVRAITLSKRSTPLIAEGKNHRPSRGAAEATKEQDRWVESTQVVCGAVHEISGTSTDRDNCIGNTSYTWPPTDTNVAGSSGQWGIGLLMRILVSQSWLTRLILTCPRGAVASAFHFYRAYPDSRQEVAMEGSGVRPPARVSFAPVSDRTRSSSFFPAFLPNCGITMLTILILNLPVVRVQTDPFLSILSLNCHRMSAASTSKIEEVVRLLSACLPAGSIYSDRGYKSLTEPQRRSD